MTLEAWDMKYKPNLDWNHAWGSAPANIITRYMWGIRPVNPGFGKVEIKPQMGRLKYSQIKAPTLKGFICSEYKAKGKKRKIYTIELPEKLNGDFVLDSHIYPKIKVNGKRNLISIDTIPIHSGKNKIVLK